MNLKPLAPKAVGMVAMIYKRANMITSGKMIPANMMSTKMVAFFDWNPIFHTIDQARGAAFVNYLPRNSNMDYTLWFVAITLILGLMGERWMSKNMSASWGKAK